MFVTQEELIYFKAMCYKKLQMYEESQYEYKSLNKALRLSEGRRLIKYVFSITILPLQTNRKVLFLRITFIVDRRLPDQLY